MKLYGTTTSPFARRVRVIAIEIGEPIELVDTAPDAGQAALREVTPIRKVPVAVLDSRTLFDSRVIIDWLTTTRGWGQVLPPRDRWREQNLLNAIDDALESVIQVFYLKRDGVAIEGTPYEKRQIERADAIFAWLGTQLGARERAFDGGFGLPEISLLSTLDWMEFRKTYPTERVGWAAGIREAFGERPSMVATRPHT
jgi:glutathione S-transferase